MLLNFVTVVIVIIQLNLSAYSVDEGSGVVQPVLVLSNPSPFSFAVEVIVTDYTANGKCTFFGTMWT